MEHEHSPGVCVRESVCGARVAACTWAWKHEVFWHTHAHTHTHLQRACSRHHLGVRLGGEAREALQLGLVGAHVLHRAQQLVGDGPAQHTPHIAVRSPVPLDAHCGERRNGLE